MANNTSTYGKSDVDVQSIQPLKDRKNWSKLGKRKNGQTHKYGFFFFFCSNYLAGIVRTCKNCHPFHDTDQVFETYMHPSKLLTNS